jgi:uncharacterized membrane protein
VALSNLLLAFFIPVVLVAIIAGIIMSIGELLLRLDKERAVIVALAIAAVILVGSTVISRMSPASPSSHH